MGRSDRRIGMTLTLRTIAAQVTPQRLAAGALFVPLLAFTFPPFNQNDLPYLLRLGFWLCAMASGVLATWSGRKLAVDRFYHVGLTMPDVAFALLIFFLFTPCLWVLTLLLFSASGHEAPSLWSASAYGVLFSSGLVLISKGEKKKPAKPLQPRLVRRLPEGFEGQILRLTGRDHYVDVVTTHGMYTIRSRLADAIAEMEPVIGHCTHRSHWVAEAAVQGMEKSEGKLFLRLANGDRVPVSRKYKPQLEEIGLV
ncbi:transcriptional regulator, LytTR family [Ruegeria lacuscaerulensis ITI-1157]|nr:transcriptional regulator, LytTR family [Ruegeria lacuscaerulensis ITI-1157]